MLAAAAMNFKRMMNKWSRNGGIFLFRFLQAVFYLIKGTTPIFLYLYAPNRVFKGRLITNFLSLPAFTYNLAMDILLLSHAGFKNGFIF